MGSTLGVGMVVFFFLLSLSGMIGKDFKLAHSGAIANDTSAVVPIAWVLVATIARVLVATHLGSILEQKVH